MKFLNGLGLGLMISGAAFWCFVIIIRPLKDPNSKLLALILVAIELIISFIGIGISAYVMWKWNQ